MLNRTLSCDVSFTQKAKAVGSPIRNVIFSNTGREILETGRERLKPYSLRTKTRSQGVWRKVISNSKLWVEVLKLTEQTKNTGPNRN